MKNILNTLKISFKALKKSSETIGNSMEFLDRIIEKEPITSAIDNVIEETGEWVQKSGEIYQKSIDNISKNQVVEDLKESVLNVKEQLSDLGATVSEKIIEQADTMGSVIRESDSIIEKIKESLSDKD